MDATRTIAVFAHNEERKIIDALECVKEADAGRDSRCYVLANGCGDATVELVREYATKNPFVELVVLPVGDKANAWNVFVHEVAPAADIYFFTDGDCRIARGSLDALEHCLSAGGANAAAAVPDNAARTTARQIVSMVRQGGLAGNLYALSGEFVGRVRSRGVRLPLGLVGDDSLVGALAYWDLDPTQEWDMNKIVICGRARFSYTPIALYDPRDLVVLFRRMRRYSVRHFQNIILKPPLKRSGVDGLPHHMEDLYRIYADDLRLKWRGANTLFDWLALRQMRRATEGQDRTAVA